MLACPIAHYISSIPAAEMWAPTNISPSANCPPYSTLSVFSFFTFLPFASVFVKELSAPFDGSKSLGSCLTTVDSGCSTISVFANLRGFLAFLAGSRSPDSDFLLVYLRLGLGFTASSSWAAISFFGLRFPGMAFNYNSTLPDTRSTGSNTLAVCLWGVVDTGLTQSRQACKPQQPITYKLEGEQL